MKLCLITPNKHISMTNLLPGRFCIAYEATSDKIVQSYFRSQDHVILDNGAFEKTGGMSSDKLLSLAREIEPAVLVIPDQINTFTVANWEQALRFVGQKDKAKLPETALMYVPQCQYTKDIELWTTIEQWLKTPEIEWLGICRNVCRCAFQQWTSTEEQELNRFYFLTEFVHRGYFREALRQSKKIHLLGIGPHIWILQYAWFVDSADTASLFWQGAHYNQQLSLQGSFEDNKRPAGYFHMDYDELWQGTIRGFEWKSNVITNCDRAAKWATKADTLRRQTFLNEAM